MKNEPFVRQNRRILPQRRYYDNYPPHTHTHPVHMLQNLIIESLNTYFRTTMEPVMGPRRPTESPRNYTKKGYLDSTASIFSATNNNPFTFLESNEYDIESILEINKALATAKTNTLSKGDLKTPCLTRKHSEIKRQLITKYQRVRQHQQLKA